MNLEELNRILKVDAKGILSRQVGDLGTEYEVMMHEINLAKKIKLGEREITIPGLERNKEVLLKVLAEFKKKEERNVMPYPFARADDITMIVGVLRPELFGLDNFKQENLSVGTVNIIPQGSGNFSVPDDQIFIITDFIEFEATPVITAINFVNVDDNLPRPLETRIAFRASDLHIFELPYAVIADKTLDVDAKVEFTGNTELTPVGAWIGYGEDVPDLT